MFEELIGKNRTVVTDNPEWVSFCGPDADIAQNWGLYSCPEVLTEDGFHIGVFVFWNDDGIIYKVTISGEEEVSE